MTEPISSTGDEGVPVARWVSVAEAAETAGLQTSTIRQWYRSGRIPTQRAEGEHGAFRVPLDMVVSLAERVDSGDLDVPLDGANSSYWSAEMETALEDALDDAMTSRKELSNVRDELVETAGELVAVRDQLAFLRSQLAEASDDNRRVRRDLAGVEGERDRLRAELDQQQRELIMVSLEFEAATDELTAARSRLSALEEELGRLRTITSATTSITDNSWLELPTNTYRGPVRPQAVAPDALASLVADTRPDGDPRTATASFADRDAPAEHDEPTAIVDVDDLDDVVGAPPPRPVVHQQDFGHHDDDLLPEIDKKGRRGRR